MPKYDFVCNSCGNKRLDIFIEASKVKGNNWKPRCSSCNTIMEVVFTIPGIIWKGEAPPSKAIKAAHELDKQMEIFEEGFTCENEIKESMDMAKEEEKKREKTEGLLTTGVEKSHSKAEHEVRKKQAGAKVKRAKAQRGHRTCL